jgi:hypothetical protein
LTSDKQRKALERFFRERILVAGAASPAAGFDLAAESYWIPRPGHKLTREDFEIRMADRREIAESLDAFWKSTAYEGVGLRLCRLSRLFRDVKEKDRVSSYIYEMF